LKKLFISELQCSSLTCKKKEKKKKKNHVYEQELFTPTKDYQACLFYPGRLELFYPESSTEKQNIMNQTTWQACDKCP